MFHARTGSDTSSISYGILKKYAIKVYRNSYGLRGGLGEGKLTDKNFVSRFLK